MRAASKSVLLLTALTAALGCRRDGLPPAAQTGSLRVRLLSWEGTPLPQARARLERESQAGAGPAAEATPDPGGVAHFADVQPGRYALRAEAPGHARAAVSLEVAPGDRVATALRLEPEQVLEGLLEDARGRPLPGAVVLVWPAGPRRVPVIETRSAGDGRFQLTGLYRGTWTLLAEAPGFGTLQIDRVSIPARPLVLRLEGESRSVAGVVVRAGGEPQEGARVVLGGPGLRASRTTTTDRKGSFVFPGLGSGRYTVRAAHGRLSSPPVAYALEEDAPPPPPVRLALDAGASLQGRVVDDGGRPLPGAALELAALPADDVPELVTADGKGRFAFGPLPPGRYQLQARLAGYVQLEAPELKLRIDVTPTIDVKLARAARLSGRAVDDRGRPLAGAAVSAVGLVAGADELAVLTGALPLAAEAAELPAHVLVRRGRVWATTTDGQGRFALDDMPPGRARLELRHPETLPLRREPLFLGPGDAQDLGDLVLPGGVLLAGRVLDEAGRPLAGARVEARPAARRGAALGVASDGEGHFSLRVPAGDYALVAVAPARAPQSIFSLHADPAQPPAPIDFRLPRADGVLEGLVRGPQGQPIARAQVVALALADAGAATPGTAVRPRAAAELEARTGTLTLASGATDGTGRFRLAGLPRGAVVLEVRHADWPAVAAVATVGERATVQLSAPGGIEGEVREKGSGAFVARYELEATGPEGRRPDRITTQGAGFLMVGLQPGRWTLRVRAPGFAPVEQALEVPPGASRKEPSLRGVRVELSRGAATP